MRMNISGSCFCGLVEYEAELAEAGVGICHCRDCQIFSGSAFRTSGITPQHNFRITKGSPQYFSKVADSGAVRRMVFCGECGTHLCSLPAEEKGGFASIRVASSREFYQMKPVTEIFCASRVPWFSGLEDTVEFAGMIPRQE
jgi:hypothetical protein